MADVFVSYASEDRERARAIAEALSALGWSVWWDRQILPGETFESVIERELAKADCVIVLWSQYSVKSNWARAEADEALQRGVLVPAMIDDVRIPIAFRHVQAASLVDWTPEAADHAGFGMLLRAIRNLDVPNTGEFSALTGAPVSPQRPAPASRPTPKREPAAARPAAPAPQAQGKGFLGSHPRVIMVAGVLLVFFGALLGASVMNGGGEIDVDETLYDAPSSDVPSTEPATPPSSVIESREHEAFAAGYVTVLSWGEELVAAGDSAIVEINPEPGFIYHVYARTTSDCDVDIYINDDVQDLDTSPDATVSFNVSYAAPIVVWFPMLSATRTECTAGRGIYSERPTSQD